MTTIISNKVTHEINLDQLKAVLATAIGEPEYKISISFKMKDTSSEMERNSNMVVDAINIVVDHQAKRPGNWMVL
jgi:hypothetical protein